jgi:type IV pilus assembly protein PilA
MLCFEKHSRRNGGRRGFSLIELLIVIAIILIILSIAIPQMGKARMNAQEMAAVEEVQTINKMEIQYYSQFGTYATSLAQLGPPTSAGAAEGPQAAGLIPGKLASGSSGGYNFTVTATPTGYAISAVPKSFGSTGRGDAGKLDARPRYRQQRRTEIAFRGNSGPAIAAAAGSCRRLECGYHAGRSSFGPCTTGDRPGQHFPGA